VRMPGERRLSRSETASQVMEEERCFSLSLLMALTDFIQLVHLDSA